LKIQRGPKSSQGLGLTKERGKD